MPELISQNAIFDNPSTLLRERWEDGVVTGTLSIQTIVMADRDEIRPWAQGLVIGEIEALAPTHTKHIRRHKHELNGEWDDRSLPRAAGASQRGSHAH